MINLLHLLVRQWRQRPVRTILSVLSVSIAVAAVLGTSLAQSSVRLGNKQLLQGVEGRPAVEIVSAAGGRFETAEVPQLGDIPGVVGQFPVLSRGTIVRAQGKRLRSVLVGVPADRKEVHDALPLVSGKFLQAADEALLSAAVAQSLKIVPGDRLTVLTRRGARAPTIVGVVDASALRELSPEASMVMPLETVQEYFGLEGQVDRVRLPIAASDQAEAVQAAVARRLPENLLVQAPAMQVELADSVLRSIEMGLQFAGALSVAMAAFIILNTLRMNFGERRRDMAIVRVLGATSRQVAWLHVLEGFCLGLLGSAVGIPLGIWLGRGIGRLFARLMSAEVPTAVVAPEAVIAAVVIGPLVACLASLLPALQARRVTPIEALGDVELRHAERFPLWAIVAGLVAWSAACVLLVLVLSERLTPDAAIPSGLLMLVGFIMVIPVVLKPVVRGIVWCLARWFKVEGGLAAEQLLRRPTRTGLTVGVLVVAVSSSVGMGNALVNNVNDARGWWRRTMAADFFLSDTTGATADTGADQDRLRETIAAQPGVDYVVEFHHLSVRANGFPTLCIARDFEPRAGLPWVLSPSDEPRVRERLHDGDAVVCNALARRLGLHPGDTFRLEAQGRIVPLRVAAVVNDYFLGGLAVYLEREAAKKMIDLGAANWYMVRAQPDAAIPTLGRNLMDLGQREGLVVNSFAQFRNRVDQLIDSVVAALWSLLAVGFVIGGVAVANTLTMSVLEQTREIGLLRIVGMTRQQVRKLILCESLLLGIVGILMGILAGVVTALVIHLGNGPLLGRSIPFAFHPWLLAAGALGGLLISLVAAWSPGERAARLDLLSAIAYE